MALGANRQDVFSLTIGQTGRLTAGGSGIGLVLPMFRGRFMEGILSGAITHDLRLQGSLALILIPRPGGGLRAGAARRAHRSDCRPPDRVTAG
jgi:hypothetical protein